MAKSRTWDDDPELPGAEKAERLIAEAERKRQENGTGKPNGADPAPIVLVDAGENEPIPPREWLLGLTFCRAFLSALVSPGGTGKTALRILQALAVATNRPLTGEHVHRRGRVLYITLEDSMDELRRRVRAARIRHRIEPEEISGWMKLWAPPRVTKIAIKSDQSGSVVAGSLEAQLRALIIEHGFDLVIFDPFIKSYGGDIDENANAAIDAVCEILIHLSIELNFAPDVLHHDSKTTREPGDVNRGRGASAFRDAGRIVFSLTTMSAEEAKQFGLSSLERRSYVRLDSTKVNLAPAITARWFQLVGVTLGNGTDEYPNGDTVQTVVRWNPPETWQGLSYDVLNTVLTEIDGGLPNGQRYSAAGPTRPPRAAWLAVKKHAPEKLEAQCREIIRTWVNNQLLYHESYDDPVERKPRQGLKVNNANRPSTAWS